MFISKIVFKLNDIRCLMWRRYYTYNTQRINLQQFVLKITVENSHEHDAVIGYGQHIHLQKNMAFNSKLYKLPANIWLICCLNAPQRSIVRPQLHKYAF